MKFVDKLLDKSNSYNYYKNNYEKIGKKYKKSIKEIKKLKNENTILNKNLSSSYDEIIKLQKRLGKFSKPIIMKKLIDEEYSDLTIAIKTPNPVGHHHWGDYFFAVALKINKKPKIIELKEINIGAENE